MLSQDVFLKEGDVVKHADKCNYDSFKGYIIRSEQLLTIDDVRVALNYNPADFFIVYRRGHNEESYTCRIFSLCKSFVFEGSPLTTYQHRDFVISSQGEEMHPLNVIRIDYEDDIIE